MSVDEERLVELTAELVERASENPPGNERAVADFLAERLRASPVGFDVERYEVEPDRPNVVARAGDADGGTVLLAGHTDVVPATPDEWTGDPYALRRNAGRLVGRGASDMKAALAAKVLAAESALADGAVDGEVVLAFVVDEEWNGAGMRALVDRGIAADYAIIGEPTNLNVCVAQKGVARYRLTVRGKSAHSGRPDRGVNAITGMRRALDRIEELDPDVRRTTSHSLLAPETITVTEIDGGIGPNVVPDRVVATVDWRTLPGRDGSVDAFDRRIESALDGLSVDGTEVDVSSERLVFARAAEIPSDHPLAATVVEAARDSDADADAVGFDAATDARFLIRDAGIPTVLFGPGSIEEDAHTVDESVAVDDVVTTARVYESAIRRLLA
ncbi:M20 family metallopeptidase [Haladaptatus salinisoli]|uniref:M20 family metallopeptidase n=1 Tax=Haladaptatus salinisoli TaxID=2884876 RepID=UPI001D0A0C6E|nr:M20 family metallopeptidase [Haladaptatus salinisoli]